MNLNLLLMIVMMTDYHFKYEGECVITAETYEEAKKQLEQMFRGIYSYHLISASVGMLAKFEDEIDD